MQVGVMALDKARLVAAYALMLAGLLARLCLPRVEASLFDAFNDLDTHAFWANLYLAVGGCPCHPGSSPLSLHPFHSPIIN